MKVLEFFKLSSGSTALVGRIEPNINKFISEGKADLYIDGYYIKSITLVGEDRFSGGDRQKRVDKRAVRTVDDLYEQLRDSLSDDIKLIIYDK